VVDISVENNMEPVKELGRILQAGKDTLRCRSIVGELDHASGKDKSVALRNLEEFLESRADRAYIDAWMELGIAQLEMGLKEKAVETFRKYLEISPGMAPFIRGLVAEGRLPEEILE
jgi:tetratricopeptide (TPR) repeat protein